jgi:hypothetical protein
MTETANEGFCSNGFSAVIYQRTPEQVRARHLALLDLEGCLFQTSDPLMLGQELDLEVYLDGLALLLKIRGTVVRLISSRHFTGVGVRFRNLPFESERMIARWMDQRAVCCGGVCSAAQRAA